MRRWFTGKLRPEPDLVLRVNLTRACVSQQQLLNLGGGGGDTLYKFCEGTYLLYKNGYLNKMETSSAP